MIRFPHENLGWTRAGTNEVAGARIVVQQEYQTQLADVLRKYDGHQISVIIVCFVLTEKGKAKER